MKQKYLNHFNEDKSARPVPDAVPDGRSGGPRGAGFGRWARGLLGLSLSTGAAAGGFEALVQVSVEISPGCLIMGADFGRLDFGAPGPLWSGTLMTDARASVARVVCSPEIAGFLISIDGGRHGDPSSRFLVRPAVAGGRVARLPYNVYRDAARRTPYVPGIPQAFFVDDGNRSVAVPLYGAVSSPAGAPPSGRYEDVLGITLNW
jgi:spore coat protein U-like protein